MQCFPSAGYTFVKEVRSHLRMTQPVRPLKDASKLNQSKLMRWKGYSGGAIGLREMTLVALARAQGSHSVVEGAVEGSRTSTCVGRCSMTSGPGCPRRLCHCRLVPEASGG